MQTNDRFRQLLKRNNDYPALIFFRCIQVKLMEKLEKGGRTTIAL